MPKGKYIPIEIGQRFGRLTVVRPGPRKRVVKREGATVLTWICDCDCGAQVTVIHAALHYGRNKSCGCLRVEMGYLRGKSTVKHGDYGSLEYKSWSSMRRRCLNPKCTDYRYYGGRGITVCARWDDYASFLSDMGRRPSPQHSLDRFPDQNGNYEPSNCRWATPTEQHNNTRYNRIIKFDGQSHSLCEWARILGINKITLHGRIVQRGWPIQMAFTLPVGVAFHKVGRKAVR